MRDLANELVENFKSTEEGISVSFTPINPKRYIRNDDLDVAKKVSERIDYKENNRLFEIAKEERKKAREEIHNQFYGSLEK